MAILVTGATGIIGANTVRFLAEQGKDIVVYDTVPPASDNVFADMMDRVKVEIGNVNDLSHVLHVIKRENVEGIIHFAAIVGASALAVPLDTLQVNIIGSANMLEAARLMGLKRVILCSSSAVMGAPEDIVTPRKEEDYCFPLLGTYAVSKLACEQMTYSYRELYKVDAICLRPRNVFGPGMERLPAERVGPRPEVVLFNEAIAGQDIHYDSGGDWTMEWTYVKDFAKGVVQAYNCSAPRHYVYNISFGKVRSLFQFCDVLRKVFPGLTIEIGPGPWAGSFRVGKHKPPQDITRAREDFGYEPEWDLDRAIPHWVRWIKERVYE